MMVFFYGTLKTGGPNHYLLKGHGQCVLKGKGMTVEKYPLVITTYYKAPFLLYKPGIGHYIEGEVYEVDEECLDHVDFLENHPLFYERKSEEIRLKGEHGKEQTIQCHVYFIVKFREHLLDLPMYSCYTDNIDGQKFIMPTGESVQALPLYEIHKEYEKPKNANQ